MLVTLAVCLVLLLVLSPTEALLPAKLFGMKGLIKGLKVTKLLGLKGLKKGKASKILRLAGLKSNIQFILHYLDILLLTFYLAILIGKKMFVIG